MWMVQGFLHPSPAICPHRQPLNLSRGPVVPALDKHAPDNKGVETVGVCVQAVMEAWMGLNSTLRWGGQGEPLISQVNW